MKYDRLWERLIEYLNEWASAREVPAGIEVSFEQRTGDSRTIEIVVTPDQWDDYITTIFGDGDPAVTGIRASVLAMPVGQRYLVYDGPYDWVPSATPRLPADWLDLPSVESGGEWVAQDRQGRVISRFADWTDPE